MSDNRELKANFTKISNFVIRDASLSPYAKAIFILIRSYSPSYPSYDHISKGTGIRSRTTISKGISELCSKNLVHVIHSPKHKSNLYEFPAPQRMDTPRSNNGLMPVQEMDTNKTKLIIPSNKAERDSTDPPVEPLNYEKCFNEAFSFLGPNAGLRYKPKKRPTFFIEP